MPSAWTQNYYHMVFSTRGRSELISADLESRLYPFMGGILRDLGASLIVGNGGTDHVHLLARYPAKLSHADMLRHVKSRSSRWIRETFPTLRRFAWQEGYGGFTVSKSMAPTVEAYIARQMAHHTRQDFRSEFLELLRRHDIEFDEAMVFK